MVSIGGNDFDFASVVADLRRRLPHSPTWWKDYCHDDRSVTANFTSANVTAVRARVAGGASERRDRHAQRRVRRRLVDPGGPDLPVARSRAAPASATRESGYTRQSTGGCGFWNSDADWANDTALPTINSAVRGAADRSRA